jgi:hypothetical protein
MRAVLKSIQVYDPRAATDIFTYGPREIVIKMLLNMDVTGMTRVCEMNERVQEICQEDEFRRNYFNLHSLEILDELEKIMTTKMPDDPISPIFLRRSDVTESERKFYEIWSRIAGDKWNPAINDNDALLLATQFNRLEAVKLLLKDPRVDPTFKENFPIYIASSDGKLEMVNLLLKDPRVDPSGREDYTMKMTAKFRHKEVLDVLKKWYRKHKKEVPNINISKSIVKPRGRRR